jgi:DnaD/phage-associated family protein
MNRKGNFRINREMFDTDIFKYLVDFRLYFLICSQAMFKDNVKAGNITLQKGEWLRSYRQLQKDLEYIDGRTTRQPGIATIKRSVERLTAERLICTRTEETGTVFRVLESAPPQAPAAIPEQTAERIAEHHNGTKRNKEVLRNKELEEINIQRQQPRARERINFFDTYYTNIGRMLNSYQREALTGFIDHDGIEEEAVCLAIQETAKNGGAFPYLETILKNWLAKGITTAEQAARAERERRERINDQRNQHQKAKQTTQKIEYTQKGRIETKPRIQTDLNPSW